LGGHESPQQIFIAFLHIPEKQIFLLLHVFNMLSDLSHDEDGYSDIPGTFGIINYPVCLLSDGNNKL